MGYIYDSLKTALGGNKMIANPQQFRDKTFRILSRRIDGVVIGRGVLCFYISADRIHGSFLRFPDSHRRTVGGPDCCGRGSQIFPGGIGFSGL